MKRKTSLKINLIIAVIIIILLVGITLFFYKDSFIKNESTKYKENNSNEVTTSKKSKSWQAKESIQDKTEERSTSTTKESKTSKKDSKKTTKKKTSKKKDEKDKNKTSGSKTTSKTGSTTGKTTSEVKQNVTVKTTKSKDQVNNELRNNIKAKYGVSVSYKDEVDSNYSSSYVKPTKLYDDTEIYNHLLEIDSALSKYPKAFFFEIKNKWKQVTIDLVKNING